MAKSTIKFTPNQKKAIRLMATDNVQLIACAGSGKTEIVSRGIGEIVAGGADPSSIVAFTFTEKAAEELKARVRSVLGEVVPGKTDLGDIYVGTIHSYCFEQLKELKPEYRSFDALDDATRIAYVSKPYNYYHRLKLAALEGKFGIKRYSVISEFVRSVDIVADEGISLKRLRKSEPELAASIEAYRKCLAEDRYVDFATMIHGLVTLLEKDSNLRKELHSRLRYLVVDEYQDINGLQERLIEAMVGPKTRITVVGDDDQSIYAWRGSVVHHIVNFRKRFRNVKLIKLEENFRSTKGIVDLANRYIQLNGTRLSKSMRPHGPANFGGGDIQYRHFASEEQQVEFIVRRIRELMGADFPAKDGTRFALSLGDVGILARRNGDIERLLPFLDEAGIRYVVDSGELVFEQPIVQLALEYLDYVFGIGDIGLKEIVDLHIAYLRSHGHTKVKATNVKKHVRQIRVALDRIKAKHRKDYLPELGLQGVFFDLLRAMGIATVDFAEPQHFYLATLSQSISDYEKVWMRLRHSEYKWFRGFVTAWAQHAYAVSDPMAGWDMNAVKVMTIHKAKGLEFPVVFLPYLVQKKPMNRRLSLVPDSLFDAARYKGNEEDDRRVNYVAITRSQKYLFLSGIRNDTTVKKPREPARMIAELDQKLLGSPARIRATKSRLAARKPDISFATTFSDLSAYGRCGYDYKLRHVFGYNAGVPAAFGYGTQLHNILNIIHKKHADGKLSDKEINRLVDKHFFLRYAPGAMSDGMRKSAKNVVKNYVRKNSGDFNLILETEKRFEMALGDALIAGQIDLLKKLDSTGSVREVEVVDFKSDESLLYKVDHQHQLRLYVAASKDALGLDPKLASIRDLDSGKREMVDIDEQKLSETKKILLSRIDGIRQNQFVPVSVANVCSECDFTRICRHARSR